MRGANKVSKKEKNSSSDSRINLSKTDKNKPLYKPKGLENGLNICVQNAGLQLLASCFKGDENITKYYTSLTNHRKNPNKQAQKMILNFFKKINEPSSQNETYISIKDGYEQVLNAYNLYKDGKLKEEVDIGNGQGGDSPSIIGFVLEILFGSGKKRNPSVYIDKEGGSYVWIEDSVYCMRSGDGSSLQRSVWNAIYNKEMNSGNIIQTNDLEIFILDKKTYIEPTNEPVTVMVPFISKIYEENPNFIYPRKKMKGSTFGIMEMTLRGVFTKPKWHFVAYRQGIDGNWYKCSDEKVNRCSQEDAIKAYNKNGEKLLFSKKKIIEDKELTWDQYSNFDQFMSAISAN